MVKEILALIRYRGADMGLYIRRGGANQKVKRRKQDRVGTFKQNEKVP